MLRHGERAAAQRRDRPLTLCDLTQSYSPTAGGGISTYLREKRDYILARTPHHLVQIVPGPADRVTGSGRHTLIEVAADMVRGSPDYRFILRVGAVRAILAEHRPDLIESLCPWVLPWAAIHHRRRFPGTALVAGYRTDFPNAHVKRVAFGLFGPVIGRGFHWLSLGYARATYQAFDWVYTLGEDARTALARLGIARTSVLPLGVDTELFSPARRDPAWRAELGLPGNGPLLVYAGRIDNEKSADRLVSMFRRLPPGLGAAMVMVGDGKLRAPLIVAARDLPIAFPGFEPERTRLARALASGDIYVSAMANETFGISVLEAQAAGLPVVGVASGAMPARVPAGLGLLSPVDDVDAMAGNVAAVWRGDPRAMGGAARAHVEHGFSWRRTFERLFVEVYPPALARAAARAPGGRVRVDRREIAEAAGPPV
ncbi:glycosyltransferase [uncultured Sphingomonas sp.]|uniref:glycosyltransferase n=1 Tax=uncultured Sphingomonas sp. TaxID=158754 RepID=UPI0035CB7655